MTHSPVRTLGTRHGGSLSETGFAKMFSKDNFENASGVTGPQRYQYKANLLYIFIGELKKVKEKGLARGAK